MGSYRKRKWKWFQKEVSLKIKRLDIKALQICRAFFIL